LDAVDLRGAHDFRHTFATWMAARVVTAIQARLTVVVHTAEDSLEAQPTQLSRHVF
jgi:integrase